MPVRRRDILEESFVIASRLGIGNPLDLPCAMFDALLRLVHERPEGGPDQRPWHVRYIEEMSR